MYKTIYHGGSLKYNLGTLLVSKNSGCIIIYLFVTVALSCGVH